MKNFAHEHVTRFSGERLKAPWASCFK